MTINCNIYIYIIYVYNIDAIYIYITYIYSIYIYIYNMLYVGECWSKFQIKNPFFFLANILVVFHNLFSLFFPFLFFCFTFFFFLFYKNKIFLPSPKLFTRHFFSTKNMYTTKEQKKKQQSPCTKYSLNPLGVK